jgi:hypothetical protein
MGELRTDRLASALMTTCRSASAVSTSPGPPTCKHHFHAAWQPGRAEIAAAGGAGRKHARIASKQSKDEMAAERWLWRPWQDSNLQPAV